MKALSIVTLVQRTDTDEAGSGGRMDKFIVSEIDPYMVDLFGAKRDKENQISGLQFILKHGLADFNLFKSMMW